MDKNLKVYLKLEKLFLKTEFPMWEGTESAFMDSKPIKKISSLFPKWFFVYEKAIQTDKHEAIRTLRHTLHTLQVYFLIKNNQYEKNINQKNLASLRIQLEELFEYHPLYVLLILLYHDIGRPFNRLWHTIKSEEIISQLNLLEHYNLPKSTEKLILIVIKHHLLVGTIFTGESSYFGSLALYSELRKGKRSVNDSQIQLLFKTMKCFTLIDIWGYDYAKIYNHYFSYYNEICHNLTELFQESFRFKDENAQKQYLKEALLRLDDQNLKWRIACALRIFQFISIKPYLTEEFFFSKIEKGLVSTGTNWDKFQTKIGDTHAYCQFKYALPLMMILAIEQFQREPIDETFTIQPKIFSFWKECAEIVEKEHSKRENSSFNLFYFVFNLPRHWFFDAFHRKRVRTSLLKILANGTFSYNSTISNYILTINMDDLVDDSQ